MTKVLYFVLSLLLIVGCQTKDLNITEKSKDSSNKSAPQILTIIHDTTTPERAFIGHWVSDDGRTHYYISSDKLITVNIQDLSYKVLSSDIQKNNLRIRAGTKTGSHEKNIEFSNDGKSMIVAVELMGTTVRTKLKYLDDKTTP